MEKAKIKSIQRALAGAPIGIGIGYVITVIISMVIGDGAYHAAAPKLIERFGEMPAVLAQLFGCMIVGAVFSAASLIFTHSNDSIIKQSSLHFISTMPILLVVGLILNWFEATVSSVLTFVLIALGIYFINWVIGYWHYKHEVDKINQRNRTKIA